MIRVVHVLEPEPEGTIGGADTHVLQLSKAQTVAGAIGPSLFINQNHMVAAAAIDRGINVLGDPELRARKLASALSLVRCVEHVRPDILHCHGYDANFILVLARLLSLRSLRLPTVMTCHGWVESYFSQRLKTALDFVTYSSADALIVCARSQIKRLERCRQQRPIHYVPNGVERECYGAPPSSGAARVSQASANGSLLIGCVGRLSKEKNWPLALSVFVQAAQLEKRAHLVFVGEGPERRALMHFAQQLGIAERVIFTGFVPDIGRVYEKLDVLLLTSLTETTSRATLEAMLYGVPVIASRVGGLPDIIEPDVSGFLCSLSDKKEFVRALSVLLADPGRRSAMGLAGATQVSRNFTTVHMEAGVRGVYESVLNACREDCDKDRIRCTS